MDVPGSFGLWVKQLRKELDLTQAELAGRAACSPVTIKKIEADERRPSKQMADMLARFTGNSLADETIPGECAHRLVASSFNETGIHVFAGR